MLHAERALEVRMMYNEDRIWSFVSIRDSGQCLVCEFGGARVRPRLLPEFEIRKYAVAPHRSL